MSAESGIHIRPVVQGVAVAVLLALSAQMMLTSNSSEAVTQDSVEERGEIINVDITDPRAIKKWAHGFCRGQTLEHLASVYEVKPTIEAVTAAMSQGLPDQAQRIVAEVCEAELLGG